MATPLSADEQLKAYKASGIKNIHENGGWRTRGIWRISAKGWSPVGIIIHQTAGNLGSRTVQQYMDDIINDDPACPDKCNVAVAPDGTLWVNAAGRANHCLQYSSKALNAIKTGSMPLDRKYADYRGSAQNMNFYTYGVEMIATNPTEAQIDTAARWAAALCRAHGWSAGHVAGHGEVADDRDYSDPGIDMGKFRTRVDALLKNKTNQEDDTMQQADWERMERLVRTEISRSNLSGKDDVVYTPDKKSTWPWRTALWSISYYAFHSYQTVANIATKLGAKVSK